MNCVTFKARMAHMRTSCCNAWLLSVLAAATLAAEVRTIAEDWPRYGHDQALTGRSSIHGDIDKPQVAWTFSLAGRELLIDGQGGDEIIYPAGNTLVVITGDRTAGRVLWTWQGPAALSLPAIADVDGDSLAEIVVQDANATIHCLNAKP